MTTIKQIIEFGASTSPQNNDYFIVQNIATSAASSLSFATLSSVITGGLGGISSNSSRISQTITQSSHGFSAGQVVGFTGFNWILSKADTAVDSEALGVIESVTKDTFVLITSGYISLPTASFTAGTVYFLSPTVAGSLDSIDSTKAGQVSKPVLIALSTTTAIVYAMRGSIVNNVDIVDTINNQTISGNKTFTNTLYLGAGVNNPVSVVNGSYNVLSTDNTLLVNTSSTTGTVILPLVPINGESHKIKCLGTNPTVINNNTANIDGVNGTVVLTNGQFVELRYSGAIYGWIKV